MCKLTVQDILQTFQNSSKILGYPINSIYRGESRLHKEPPYNGRVSSNLWRKCYFDNWNENFDINAIQSNILDEVKNHSGNFQLKSVVNFSTTDKTYDDINYLFELQHYGGKTNLIDFTRDYLVAIFFACDGYYDEDGRVISQVMEGIRNIIIIPDKPRHRVISQKSVFVMPHNGFIQPSESDITIIPSYLKKDLLDYLRKYHDISVETIYNDLHGFIRHQENHIDAYTSLYKGISLVNLANEEENSKKRIEIYTNAIEHLNKSITLKPNLANSYYNRSMAHLNMGNIDEASDDIHIAISLNTKNSNYFNLRGMIASEKGWYQDSINDYTIAISLDEQNFNAYMNRGKAYIKTGYDKNNETSIVAGIRDCERARELDPNFQGFNIYVGLACIIVGSFDIARSLLRIQMDQLIMDEYLKGYFMENYGSVSEFKEKCVAQLPEDILDFLEKLDG